MISNRARCSEVASESRQDRANVILASKRPQIAAFAASYFRVTQIGLDHAICRSAWITRT